MSAASRQPPDSQERYRRLFDDAPIPITYWERTGDTMVCAGFNHAADELAGGNAAKLVGHTVDELYADQPEVLSFTREALAAPTALRRELSVRSPADGKLRRLDIQLSPSGDRLVLAHIRDVTELREMEERARRAAEFESLVLATTSKLIGLPLEDCDREIERLLAATGAFLGADYVGVAAFDAATDRATIKQHWHFSESRLRPNVEELAARPFLWQRAQFAKGEGIVIRKLADFQAADREAKQFLAEVGAQAGLAYPLNPSPTASAFLGVLSAAPHDWSQIDISCVRVVASVVAGVLERQRRENDMHTLERAIQQTGDHVLITDNSGRIEYANPAFQTLTGYRLEEIRGQTPRLFSSGQHRASFYSGLWKTILAGRVFHGEFVNRKKSGELYLEEKTISPIRDAHGVITHFVSTGRDITAARESKLELQRSRESLLEAQQMAQIGSWDGDVDGDTALWSNELYRIFGVDPAVFRPTYEAFLACVHPDDRELVVAARTATLAAAGQPVELEHRVVLADGSLRWVLERSRVLLDGAGVPVRLIGTTQNITERKLAELRQSELARKLGQVAQEWRFTFDEVEFPTILLDRDLVVRRINIAAARELGRTPAQCVARPFEELCEAEHCRRAAALARLANTHHDSRREQMRDGNGNTWEIHAGWHYDAIAEQEWIVLTSRELTEVMRLRESLEQARLMSALGSLIAGVAHEVRNPLFGISATLDAVEELHGGRMELVEFLTAMRKQVARLSSLMEDLLVYGRPARIVRQRVAVGDLLDEAIATNADLVADRGVTVERQLATDLPGILADTKQVVMALRNVVDNAVRFTPRGGTIRASAVCEGTPAGECVRIRIEDQGPGFAVEDIAHVFEPFFTHRRGGTGLGLSIVERCMALHGGAATVGNLPAGGAVVTLRFPVLPASGS
jgi:PAS domain S-box-containing protein